MKVIKKGEGKNTQTHVLQTFAVLKLRQLLRDCYLLQLQIFNVRVSVSVR